MVGPSRGRAVKHLLSIEDLDRTQLEQLLDLSERFVEVTRRDIPKVPALRGKTVVSLFYEDSTRTRISFETAAKRLSADTMTFTVASSSVNKGESLRDTVQTIEAMGIDAVVVRHPHAGAPHRITGWIDAAILNAGDGRHQHPTQALLDVLTLRLHRGPSLEGMRIAIVGDVRHSREYTSRYGLTAARAARLAKDALVMHPGPINRGVEIAAEVADSSASIITQQVASGVAVRMAVLYTLLGSGGPVA